MSAYMGMVERYSFLYPLLTYECSKCGDILMYTGKFIKLTIATNNEIRVK